MKALKVPFEFDPSGRTAKVRDEFPVMATYIRTLLLTRIGERVMRPTYGSAVQGTLFEPLDEVTVAELDGDIRDAIRSWEPDVDLRRLDFEIQESVLTIDLEFRVRSNLSGESSTLSVEIDRGGTVQENAL